MSEYDFYPLDAPERTCVDIMQSEKQQWSLSRVSRLTACGTASFLSQQLL